MASEFLDEAQRRLWLVVMLFVAVFLLGFAIAPELIAWMGREIGVKLYAFSPLEAFYPIAHVSMALAVGITAPFALWQALLFVNPALTSKEKQLITSIIVPSLFLFAVGVTFGWLLLVKIGFAWLKAYGASSGFTILWGAGQTIGLAVSALMLCGISFQFPLLLISADKLGLISLEEWKAKQREAVFGLAVASAFITPSWDPITMLLFWVPLVVLYEATLYWKTLSKAMQARTNYTSRRFQTLYYKKYRGEAQCCPT